MKLLILHWGAFTQFDIIDTLQNNHVTFRQVGYRFANYTHDNFFIRHFTKYLLADSYDAVFTVNYFPLVAQVCHDNHVKYIAWSYDNPLNIPSIEDTLGYETNYVFLFDRIQAETYQNKGYNNVYHMPLGINTTRLQKLHLSSSDWECYGAEISFVGKLYYSTFHDMLAPLDDYHRGYLQAIAQAQSKIYGYYFIDELLTDSFMEELNHIYQKASTSSEFMISREQLSYSLATNITHEERLTILNLLAKQHQLKLYSGDIHPVLRNVTYCGTTNYGEEMNKIFHASKINLNINLKISQSGIPLRALDIMGSGGFLLSSYQPEIAENFIADSEAVFYSDIPEAIEKADFYLTHDDIRRQIALNGQQKAFDQFNYTRLFTEIFQTAGIL